MTQPRRQREQHEELGRPAGRLPARRREPLEQRLLDEWIDRASRPDGHPVRDAIPIPPSRRRRPHDALDPRLEAVPRRRRRSAAGAAARRVAAAAGARAVRAGGFAAARSPLGDPRDPGPLRQAWVARRHPERAARSSPASRRRSRSCASAGGAPAAPTSARRPGLADFVARQAALALERAERRAARRALQGAALRRRGHPRAAGVPRRHRAARARARQARGGGRRARRRATCARSPRPTARTSSTSPRS